MQLRHKFKVHSVAGGHQSWRQEHHRHHREDLNDAVLFDIDKAHRRLHQEVHLLEQRFVVRQQGFDIAQDLPRLLQLARRQARLTHEEVQRALGIHQTEADLPADIFQFRQRRQRFVVLIALVAFHNHAAQLFQVAVDVFYLIRQLFDFGLEQI